MPAVPPVRRTGPDSCPGALRVHAAADGGLARVRIPGGRVSTLQWRALAAAARRHGTGVWELTGRGNVQLRGIAAGAEGELAADLAEAGLLPSPTHETVRNIVASPLSGRDGAGSVDVRRWAAAVDHGLCADPELAALPGRFLVALDDGRGDVRALAADVTVLAVTATEVAVLLGGVDVGVRVPCDGVVGVVLAVARAFLTVRAADDSAAWRLGELPDGPARVAAILRADMAGVAASPPADIAGVVMPRPDDMARIGVISQRDGLVALGVLAPLGRLVPGHLDLIGELAATELIVTPWREVILPDLTPTAAEAARVRVTEAGLVTDPASPWAGVSSCTGLPGCARSHADVRAAATRTVVADHDAIIDIVGSSITSATDRDRTAGGAVALRPVHWAGCERRCGHPATPAVDVVATPTGYTVTSPAGPTVHLGHTHVQPRAAHTLGDEARVPEEGGGWRGDGGRGDEGRGDEGLGERDSGDGGGELAAAVMAARAATARVGEGDR